MSKQEVIDADFQFHTYVDLMKQRSGKASVQRKFLDEIVNNPALAAAAASRLIALPAHVTGEIVDRMAPSNLDPEFKQEVLLDFIAIDNHTLEVYNGTEH